MTRIVIGMSGGVDSSLAAALLREQGHDVIGVTLKLWPCAEIDGGFTRTTNMRVAVQEGATLVILVDPMVPVVTTRPGHVAERGADGLDGFGRRAERIFVGGELVDFRRIEAEFPRDMRDRLAGLVDRLVENAGLGKLRSVHG